MTKYAIVPVEPLASMLDSDSYISGEWSMRSYSAIIAARPPLGAEMLEALELAKTGLSRYRDDSRWQPNAEDALEVYRAYLRAAGEETT